MCGVWLTIIIHVLILFKCLVTLILLCVFLCTQNLSLKLYHIVHCFVPFCFASVYVLRLAIYTDTSNFLRWLCRFYCRCYIDYLSRDLRKQWFFTISCAFLYTQMYWLRCTENHIFFFQTSWKDGLSKKIVLEYDLSCIIGKDYFCFSRKYDLAP